MAKKPKKEKVVKPQAIVQGEKDPAPIVPTDPRHPKP